MKRTKDPTQTTAPQPPVFTAEQVRAIRRKLLSWYRKGRRAMPWRPEPGQHIDPYYTLVSEAMLQQTQVATVIAYFERFVAEFPTVHALADADEQRVLRQWQGLGYYRRARNLHAAAKMIVAQFDGTVPRDVTLLLQLPGVGRYTAGAIASIAYDTPAPIVDGNVDRVLARLLNLREPVDQPSVKKHIWALAEQLVPKKNAGDFNQSMMELGAMVCTPKSPKCLVCPVRSECAATSGDASGGGDPESLPIKLPKKKPTAVTHVVFAIHRKGKYLFEQRPATGLWSNMWQLPTWESPPPEVIAALIGSASRRVTPGGPKHEPAQESSSAGCDPAAKVTPLNTWFHDRFNLTLTNPTLATDFPHQTTHRTIRFVVVRADVTHGSGRLKPNTAAWRSLKHLDDLPLPNPQQTAIQTLS